MERKKLCIERGFKPAVDTPYPDLKTGDCPEKFHKCGTGSFDEKRAFCASDDTDGCPISWVGSDDVLDVYFASPTPASVTTALDNADYCVAPSTCANADIGGDATYFQTQTIYSQAGSNGVGMPNWSPLPIVEIEVAFKSSKSGGPCYGDLSLQGGARHDEYAGVTNNIDGQYKASSPDKCAVDDTRWKPANVASGDDFGLQNMYKYSAYCKNAVSGTDYNYFSTSTKCSTYGTDPDDCLLGSFDLSGVNTAVNCGDDNTCKQAFWQTNCGAMQTVFSSSDELGVFQKTQIYWSSECKYSYEDVVKNNGPLQKAIDWQTNLFYLNAGINGILLLLSFYIIYLTVKNWGTTKTEYAELEEVWKPRAEFFGNWIKVPVVIITIVFTSAVSGFFTNLAKESCSDDMTNSTFEELGESLPGVVSANAIVLAVDVVGLIPVIYKWYVGDGKEAVSDTDSEEAAVELTNIAPSASDANSNEDGKIYTYAEDNQTGSEGKIEFPDGGVYIGFIFKQMRHNDGIMTYADGHEYEGQWKNDMRDGYGTLTKDGTQIYAGDWFQDNRNKG